METGKIFQVGDSQAVLLPEKFRFDDSVKEVVVKRIGDMLILVPRESVWETFMEGIHGFSDDFMADGRAPDVPVERKWEDVPDEESDSLPEQKQ